MEPTLPSDLWADYRACEALAASHYENFPVASLLLPRATRPHVAALYAFARTADDFADEPAYEGRRLKEIDRWEQGLRAALKGKAPYPYLAAFAHTMGTFRIPLSLPLALLKAFRMDANFKGFKDWPALFHYCRHSANPVGRMVLLIHGYKDPQLHFLSDLICSALQLINFWQDTIQDLSRGRIYYPQSELKKAGVRQKEFLQRKDSPRVRTLVQRSVEGSERLLQAGSPLIGHLRGRLRLEVHATCLGGLAILKKIRTMDYNVLSQRPRLSGWDKAAIGWKALLGR